MPTQIKSYIPSPRPVTEENFPIYVDGELRKLASTIDQSKEATAEVITDVSTTQSDVTTLTSTVGSFSSSITQNISSINGIESKYGIKINNNGHVSGFGLISTANDATPTSEFTVQADKFKIETTGTNSTTPFSVSGGNVFMNNAHINNLTADKILLSSKLANSGGYIDLANLGVSTDKISNFATANVADYFVGLQSIAVGGSSTSLLNVSYAMPTITSSSGLGKLSIILVPTFFGTLTGTGALNLYFYVQGAPNWSSGTVWQSITHNSATTGLGFHTFMGSDSFSSNANVNVQFYCTATGGWSGLQGGVNALLLGSWK